MYAHKILSTLPSWRLGVDRELSQKGRALVMPDTGFTDNNSAEAFSIPYGVQ
jgi:hypothetical protein